MMFLSSVGALTCLFGGFGLLFLLVRLLLDWIPEWRRNAQLVQTLDNQVLTARQRLAAALDRAEAAEKENRLLKEGKPYR